MDVVTPVAVTFAALFGAAVGSFLNVCIWRLPREGLTVASPSRSHCPSCGAAIEWFDNVPIVSWLRLGGRCRVCRAPISIRYLAVEALTATLFAVLALEYVGGADARWAEFVVVAALASALVVASFIDIDLRILPDEITLSGMMAVPLVALLVPGLHTRPPDPWVWRGLAGGRGVFDDLHALLPGALESTPAAAGVGLVVAVLGATGGLFGYRLYWRIVHPGVPGRLRDGALAGVLLGSALAVVWTIIIEPAWALHPRVLSYVTALCGMAVGSGLILVVGIVGTLMFRKEAMGFGDVKLMGLLGGFAGWGGVLGGFAIACLLGSVVGGWRLVVYRNRYLWFGPFLSAGCLLVILFPEALRRVLTWYLGLFS